MDCTVSRWAIAECRRQVGSQFWDVAVDALEALHRGGALVAETLERRAAAHISAP